MPRELVESCVDAARYAPTASNTQGWRFYVAEGGLAGRVADECLGGIVPNKFAAGAPVIIAIAMKLGVVTNRLGGRIKGIDYHVLDAGIAGEHFVLRATELGLGTCWIGWFDKKAVRKVLGIPAAYDVPALITLGYPDENPPEKSRRPLSEILIFKR